MTVNEQTMPVEKSSGVLTTGFALFSMFFGAGNLIFPLLMGKDGTNSWHAILGLGITAVIVPFLGLAGMIFFQADLARFFGRIGRIPGLLLLAFLQLILGPFGVIPRLMTLMHAISKVYLPISPLAFSLIIAGVIFLCSFKRRALMTLLGTVLTPILLLSLASLFCIGIMHGPQTALAPTSSWNSFLAGFFEGYNTMDLIAAFLFATVVLPHFRATERVRQDGPIFRKIFFSSAIAASLLLITYIGLFLISTFHGQVIGSGYQSEEVLGLIATTLLGPFGGAVASIAIVTACLTTAITLTAIFADYLQKDLCREKISTTTALMITLLIAIGFSTLGFGGIAAFLGPVLQICYPGLIVLTLLNIAYYRTGFKMVKIPVFLTFAVSAWVYFM